MTLPFTPKTTLYLKVVDKWKWIINSIEDIDDTFATSPDKNWTLYDSELDYNILYLCFRPLNMNCGAIDRYAELDNLQKLINENIKRIKIEANKLK
jgi:hypothetical protein